MEKEKAIEMVVQCIHVIARNEGLQSTSNVDSAINWNFAEIEEIIDKYIEK